MAEQPSILTVLAWLYCVANVLCMARAKPIAAPDVKKCQTLDYIDCCPPISTTVVDFKPPPASAAVRVRRPAHLADAAYVRKYEEAVRRMQLLPYGHPWNAVQQAHVHCAYCSGSYNQTDYPRVVLQVHGSWLFFPFHRAFLYFYERILGKLIGDDAFALPFWNWDAPEGMKIPAMYANPRSSLYDLTRNTNTREHNVTAFGYASPTNRSHMVSENFKGLYYPMVLAANTTEEFLGKPYRAGDGPYPGMGPLESQTHGQLHFWAGGLMADLQSAALDPIFFAHHSNVDRMWEVWKGLPGGSRGPLNDTDFLDSAFVFWDENLQLVRIKVRDLLETRDLGYVYQNVPLPWLNATA